MKKVLVAVAPGFEEIETITVVDILRRSGARVTLAGTQTGNIEGARGVYIVVDAPLANLNGADFDMIVLPGGQPGTDNLRKNVAVAAIVRSMFVEGKIIAAICAAPTILDDLGLLDGITITSHPSVQGHFDTSHYSEERVVVDKNIVTSRSPGTAMEFSMTLVEILFDRDRMEKVNSGVMARL